MTGFENRAVRPTRRPLQHNRLRGFDFCDENHCGVFSEIGGVFEVAYGRGLGRP